MRFLQASLPFISILTAGLVGVASAVTHDESFVPDAVLRVWEEERKQSCVPSKDILVVNGTSPGPTLRFTEGKTVWIRVYNDIAHQNLTMVTFGPVPLCPAASFFSFIPLDGKSRRDMETLVATLTNYELALAWPYNGNSSLLRWDS